MSILKVDTIKTSDGSGDLTVPNATGTLLNSDASGNVGIGTSSPNSSLDIQASSGEGLRLSNGGTEYATFQGNTTTGEVRIGGTYPNFYPTFYSGNTEAMRIDSSSNLKFNSGYGSVATAYGCRVWVKFDGTGTIAIRGSGNVSSVTDIGTGTYDVNFTTALPDANYSICGLMQPTVSNNGSDTFPNEGASGTSSVRLSHYEDGTNRDSNWVSVAIFR